MRRGFSRLTGLALAAALALSACVVVGVESDVSDLRKSGAPTGFIATKSDADFDTTLGRLTNAIDARKLTMFAVVDHAKGAASIDKELRPTTLVIFGSPKVGAPVMLESQTAGIDLPLKALVYEKANGSVYVATSDPKEIFRRHEIDELDAVREKMTATLKAIRDEATGDAD